MAQNDIVLNVREKGAKRTASAIKGVLRAVGGLATAYLGLRGAIAIKNLAVSSVKAYTAQALAEKKLQTVVKGSIKLYKSVASEWQKITIYGDEQTLAVMQLAKTYGVADRAIIETTKNAMGLAASLKMDVATAMRYVSLAAQGDYTMLQRYIPTLRTMTSETEKAAAVNKVFGDGWKLAQDEAKLQPWIRMKNAFSDLKEVIGKEMTPAIESMIETLTRFFEQGTAQKWAAGVGKVFSVMLGSIKGLSQLIGWTPSDEDLTKAKNMEMHTKEKLKIVNKQEEQKKIIEDESKKPGVKSERYYRARRELEVWKERMGRLDRSKGDYSQGSKVTPGVVYPDEIPYSTLPPKQVIDEPKALRDSHNREMNRRKRLKRIESQQQSYPGGNPYDTGGWGADLNVDKIIEKLQSQNATVLSALVDIGTEADENKKDIMQLKTEFGYR